MARLLYPSKIQLSLVAMKNPSLILPYYVGEMITTEMPILMRKMCCFSSKYLTRLTAMTVMSKFHCTQRTVSRKFGCWIFKIGNWKFIVSQ